ncbi:MAG TPA: ABC transporter ATP-binding protein [Solirubrobacteraceae bacterium]|nr:ABC transporter ATP-binding protein [Solirubrobacteraceae bacterium]
MDQSLDHADPVLYELTGVTRHYGENGTAVRALDGIDLTIRRGEFVAVVGPSGSGKSTLLQLLGGLDRPTGGTILFEGSDLGRARDGQLTKLRLHTIGFIFQQFNLIPTLTAQQNVEVALAPTGLKAAERERRCRELLESVGLQARAGHLPSQLSGGEQQRVAIARALANDPPVLLADEPTGNLDSATGDELIALLATLNRERGITIILITHDRAIADASPRTIGMRDGKLETLEAAPA